MVTPELLQPLSIFFFYAPFIDMDFMEGFLNIKGKMSS